MKILRAAHEGAAFYAELAGERVLRINGLPYEGISFTGEEYGIGEVVILAPCEPSKVVAVGLNYARHAGEMRETLTGSPILFMKPSTSVIAHNQKIKYPSSSARVDYEAELALVIRKKCANIYPEEANEFIFGYTALNDVTARDLQKSDGQWTRSKSFDTFCPVGPYIETVFDPKNRRVMSILNGELKQDGNTGDMLFGVSELVSFISSCMTLLPGDIIATGTPEGIGPMNKGDIIEIKIDGLETLRNIVT